ncbi:MAG: glycogen debranching enzyme GlgX [Acidobacteria bacterium]|nr:glycogen debranching enzyme GlgX [Acidobacteriota bacterium]
MTPRPKCPVNRWLEAEGSPSPLGATWFPDSDAWNFAIYSKHATGVTLLLYGDSDFARPLHRVPFDYLRNKSGRVWHCRVPAGRIRGAAYYAYCVEGPWDPPAGQRFDPDKVLLDPYARAVFFPPGFSRDAAKEPGPNAGRAALGVLGPVASPDSRSDCRPRHAWDTVIYEMHVRGFTRRANSGVARERRGTFAGVIDKIPYLLDLGVTAVELLPVFQRDPQERNYWGYMPLNFFAPHQQYAAAGTPEGAVEEMARMVAALHDAGIEVILDVVYNHTVEGNELGPTYSYRGLDNSTYYLLRQEDRSRYRNDSGTGNVLHTANLAVRKMVVESMRFWAKQMHVDGFRFDLASIFTRRTDGSIDLQDPPMIAAIDTDPDFSQIRLIAEAWDLDSYQLGRRFPGVEWLQWNDRFRDDVRAFVRGDEGLIGRLAARLYGSNDLFPDERLDAYHAYQSVNLVTAHDGFCLYDLVSYSRKHNLANGEENRDGTDHNLSWNCGWEGDIGASPEVLALRRQQARNFCCLLFLSNGTPMFCAGDEFLRTQGGNNNPYNQDNETTWLDWDLLEQNGDVFRFFKMMIAFRKAHPSIGRSRFWRDDVRWYGPDGEPDWGPASAQLAYALHGASLGDHDIYAMINGAPEDVVFTVQEGEPGRWRRVFDTARPSPGDAVDPGAAAPLASRECLVRARSIVVLLGPDPG